MADASSCGRSALAWAAELAADRGGELQVVTCHRLRWHAATLPAPHVARLVADHELQTLAAADAVLHGSGLRWSFASAGAGPLDEVVPAGAVVVVPAHGRRCGDRLGALRTLPGARSAAADLRGRVLLHYGRRRVRAASRLTDQARQLGTSLSSACYCGGLPAE